MGWAALHWSAANPRTDRELQRGLRSGPHTGDINPNTERGGIVSQTEHEGRLRKSAKGNYATEAGTELLLRAFSGRFAQPGQPWVDADKDGAWIDFDAIQDHIGP